jgi:hypothetical protein
LFKRKLLIISGVLIITGLSLVMSMVLPKVYRSEGFFQFSDPTKEKQNLFFSVASQLLQSSRRVILSQLKDLGMLSVLKELDIELTQPEHFHVITIQQFKKYASSYRNYQDFLRFVHNGKYLSAEEFGNLKGQIINSGQFAGLTKEVYALSRDDLKHVGQTLMQEKNYVVGVEMQMEAETPKTAQRYLNLLGEFVRYSILAEKLNEYAAFNLNESQMLNARYGNYILDNQAVLKQLNQKRDTFQALYKKYPTYAKPGGRQVVELGDYGEHYLSLVTQIIGIESRIIDIEQLLESFKMEREKGLLYSRFFAKLKNTIDEGKTKSLLPLDVFKHLKTEFFKDKDAGNPVTRSLLNSLEVDINRFTILYNKTLQFVSGPTLPERPEWPRKSIFVSFGFFISLLLFCALALALEFWQRHKNTIKG